jgi:iron-sulfur cluster assembly accessory protein
MTFGLVDKLSGRYLLAWLRRSKKNSMSMQQLVKSNATDNPVIKGSIVMLTPPAQNEVRRLLEDDDKGGMGLRLGIKGGGCSGLSYVLDFTKSKEGDTTLSYDGFEIYLDQKSVIYLKGIILDHQSGLAGKGFVFSNPMASNTCGCGESFSL